MDTPLILAKLDSLNRCLIRIQEKTPSDAQILMHDIDLQDIISLNLSRAVQLSVDVGAHILAELNLGTPETMSKTFDILALAHIIEPHTAQQLKKAVGFRNIAVHQYEQVNWQIVFAIATQQLTDFIAYAEQIQQHLNQAHRNP